MPPRTLLGFDFGRLRIGVAVGNTVTGTARALAIVDAEPLEERWQSIASLVDEWRPDGFVVGRPATPRDERVDAQAARACNVQETAARCERFARQLAGRFRLPVELVDESGSSLEAATTLARRRRAVPDLHAAAGVGAVAPAVRRRSGAAHRGADDAEAAAIILRQYLSRR
ncbi:MAG: Holliday junction resolvase RuvX [Burkholderiaceae bacterium]|nr:Holliday junction resolvase RuvX [Burkholderiaceae bacterium]